MHTLEHIWTTTTTNTIQSYISKINAEHFPAVLFIFVYAYICFSIWVWDSISFRAQFVFAGRYTTYWLKNKVDIHLYLCDFISFASAYFAVMYCIQKRWCVWQNLMFLSAFFVRRSANRFSFIQCSISNCDWRQTKNEHRWNGNVPNRAKNQPIFSEDVILHSAQWGGRMRFLEPGLFWIFAIWK